MQAGILQNRCPLRHFVPCFSCGHPLRLCALSCGIECVLCWMRHCEPCDCISSVWMDCPPHWPQSVMGWLRTKNLLDCNYWCCVFSDSSQGQALPQMDIPKFGHVLFRSSSHVMDSFMFSISWAGVRASGERILRRLQAQNMLPPWVTLFSWNCWIQRHAWRCCIHIPIIGLNSMLPFQNLLHHFPGLALVALPPCPTYSTTAESHLLTSGGDYFGESLISQMIDDVSVAAWAPYCTASLFAQPPSKVPFHWDKLSWDSQCQELYEHQSRATETDDCQLLRHGERGISLCRLCPESRTCPLLPPSQYSDCVEPLSQLKKGSILTSVDLLLLNLWLTLKLMKRILPNNDTVYLSNG